MIIEDPDVVQKINEHLPSQIRVWGVEQTNGGFSAYQLCDSRIYEYLIPTYCFLPPHPESFLGKELAKLAEEADDTAGFEARQKEVSGFWRATEENYIKPFLNTMDPEISTSVYKVLYDADPKILDVVPDAEAVAITEDAALDATRKGAEIQPTIELPDSSRDDDHSGSGFPDTPEAIISRPDPSSGLTEGIPKGETSNQPKHGPPLPALEEALKKLKSIIVSAKKAYRIHPARLARVQSVLNAYLGTRNFHNYTICKRPRDPSAKRVIKSFIAGPEPILINDTEWLSLKVHGQSFMMHQIRKMATMATMVVRCGCPEERMQESYGHEKLTVPKAPSLGLLLERPIFDTYNKNTVKEGVNKRGEVGFEKYKRELEEFKQREIYERIFREEERDDTWVSFSFFSFPSNESSVLGGNWTVLILIGNRFHAFFASLDGMRWPDLLYLSSMGIPAAKREMPGSTTSDTKSGVITTQALDEDSEGADEQDS
ncbi:MAG: hypothetical protein Q9219_000853 [cf. Caloplaca sp. 3 TL-2023]